MGKFEKRVLSTLSRVRKLDNWFKLLRHDSSALAFSWCRLCGNPVNSCGLCEPCLYDLPVSARLLTPQFKDIHSVWSAFRYEFPINVFISEAKFKGNAGVAKFLATLLADQLRHQPFETELLVPIPMPWPRLLWRGYNHAEVLAVELGKRLGIKVGTDVLTRLGWQPPQRGLTARQRKQNLRRAFVVKSRVADLRITLVDDVFTTGATIASAAATLRRAGARQIDAWVVAAV